MRDREWDKGGECIRDEGKRKKVGRDHKNKVMSSDGDNKQTKQKYSHPLRTMEKERKGEEKQSQPLFSFPIPLPPFILCSSVLPSHFPRNKQKKTYVGDGAGLPDDALDLFELSQSFASVSGALFNSTMDKRTP